MPVDLFDGLCGKCLLTVKLLGALLGIMRTHEAKLPAFAYEIFRQLDASETSLRGQKLLIACSGGLDSAVLLDVLLKLQPRLSLSLAVAHIHHGFSPDPTVAAFRDAALGFVKALAGQKNLEFLSLKYQGDRELRSENELRKFRLTTLDSMLDTGRFDRVALAHHADDLLETRLMRLIRGTGSRGLRSMQIVTEKTVRPFLEFPKSRLCEYASKYDVEWIDDASNSDPVFFRNWIRGVWLPMLENHKPGSARALARSLDLLVGALDQNALIPSETGSKFDRAEFSRLPLAEKQDRLARLGRSLDVRDFSASKVGEILKRLNRLEKTKQKSTSFQVGGLLWKIDSDEISVTKPTA